MKQQKEGKTRAEIMTQEEEEVGEEAEEVVSKDTGRVIGITNKMKKNNQHWYHPNQQRK